MRFWRALETIALGLWVGAMVGFGAFTAPVLFDIVPSRQVAGNVAGTVIQRLDGFGLVVLGLAALAVAGQARRRQASWLRLLPITGAALLIALNVTWVRSGLERAQAGMDRPIETYAVTDPLRVEYNVWHQRSRSLGNGYVLLGFAALAWAAIPGRGGDGPGVRRFRGR